MKQAMGECPREKSGERLDVLCVLLFPELSRKKIKAIIDNGGAFINKKRVDRAGSPVTCGSKIELFWDGDEAGPQKISANLNSVLIYEHEGFLVLNKPAGIPAQATLTSSTDTIIHALVAASSGKFSVNNLFLVHRLDKETSGIMLLARSKKWQEKIETLFRERKVIKEYQALCFGCPKEKNGVIRYSLEPDRQRKNAWRAIFSEKNISREAKSAETAYEVVENFPSWEASYVLCRPKTGRTHQIRVHLQAIGCPIIGDKTYSQGIFGHPLGQSALRHMLHASKIGLDIPGVGQMHFDAPTPIDFSECLTKIRKN